MSNDTKLQAEIKKLRDAGETYDEIGQKAGVSGALIWKIAHGQCASQKVKRHFDLNEKRYRVALEFISKNEQQKMINLLAELGPIRIWQSEVLLRLLDTEVTLKD